MTEAHDLPQPTEKQDAGCEKNNKVSNRNEEVDAKGDVRRRHAERKEENDENKVKTLKQLGFSWDKTAGRNEYHFR